MTTLEQQFLEDIAGHRMTILRDEGVCRHLRFMPKGHSAYWFDIITWPGALCIDGDIGTFVFRRLPDMFDFFRIKQRCTLPPGQTLVINPYYWGQKLTAVDPVGHTRFSRLKAIAAVTKRFEAWCKSQAPDPDDAVAMAAFESRKNELWEQLDDEVLSVASDGEELLAQAVLNFEHDSFSLEDFMQESDLHEYTPTFLRCCYALVWGIGVYDEVTAVRDGVNAMLSRRDAQAPSPALTDPP